jgi:hypothetical protein
MKIARNILEITGGTGDKPTRGCNIEIYVD